MILLLDNPAIWHQQIQGRACGIPPQFIARFLRRSYSEVVIGKQGAQGWRTRRFAVPDQASAHSLTARAPLDSTIIGNQLIDTLPEVQQDQSQPDRHGGCCALLDI